MASSTDHYQSFLGPIYSWMTGGFEAGLERNERLFDALRLEPRGSGIAIDLGAGCGFQSIPLAKRGYEVSAVDLDAGLLDELREHAGAYPVTAIQDDMLRFRKHLSGPVELVVCMSDSVLHLESRNDVLDLFNEVHAALEPGGSLVLTLRDLSTELTGSDRFIPVRSDESAIFTCFLEYEPETVKVYDLMYRREDENWTLSKSDYRKLRLPVEWVVAALRRAGLDVRRRAVNSGEMTVITAQKAGPVELAR